MPASVVIAGAGQAGLQVAVSLRQAGYDGGIVLINDEAGLPYQRPPLSKTYLKDGRSERLLLRNAAFYDKNRIELLDQIRVERIDRRARSIALSDGRTLQYGHLVLATGARNRKPPIEGLELQNVVELRTLAHADAIRRHVGDKSRAVIIGGGFIGLEFAAVATAMGMDVTVIEAAPRVMARVVSEPVSRYFVDFYAGNGVHMELGALAKRVIGNADGRACAVELADGRSVDCDLVLVAAGVVPNDELAAEAGLATDNGVIVGNTLSTDDPAISAIGDCAAYFHPLAGRRIRLESVQNATDQAKCVAARLTGSPHAYEALPWFWSDQGDRKLQIAGLTDTADDLVAIRGEDGRLCVHCFRGGQYIGLESVNAPGDHLMARKTLAGGKHLSRQDLEKTGFDLRVFRDR